MGKKIKKKAAPNPRKAHHRASAGSQKSVLEGSSPIGSGGDGDRVAEACSHYSKDADEMNRILVKIRSSSMDIVSCEHCREEPVGRRGGKEKGKQPKKKKGLCARAAEAKSGQNFMWVCLDCGRYFCGGGVSVVEPYGHARRHSKQEHHQWAVRADNPLISWCYACSSSVLIEMPEEVISGENEAAVNGRGGSLRGSALEPLNLEKFEGRIVRGLSNLGNTCFFNSVMQNLFAMDLLRDTLVCLDRPFGPLSTALRMLFIETDRGADSKGVINPKALFGCICANAPQFRGYQQQDSHELLRCLLDGLHMEETSARRASELNDEQGKVNVKTEATVVDVIFGGQLLSTVSCMECGHTSVVNEPFLDLSLPVPSRKPPSKRVPPPSSKRANQTLRDKNKSRRFRERGVSQMSAMTENQKTETTEQHSKSSESGIAVPQQAHDIASEAKDFTWMDYLGATELPDCDESGAQESETSIMHFSDSKQANETESSAQSVSELPTARCCKDLIMSCDTCGERSCRDEVLHSFAPVSGVILLPYKEQEQVEELTCLDINDRTSCSMDPKNANPMDISASECTTNSRCEQADESFDGFGDLFNEPEVTSDKSSETNVVEDMDITWCTGNTSESNLEEVDNTNAQVSINGCLSLFTKPELLSDEQAWYCERCSETLQKNRELETSKLQTAKVSDQSVTVKSMVDEDELESKKLVPHLHGNSANANILDNGELVSLPKDVAMLVERSFYPLVEATVSKKSVSHAEGSQNSGEISRNGMLDLAEITPCYKETMDSETSRCLSTPTICENSQAQDDSSIQECDRSTVGDVGITPDVLSNSLQFNTNLAPNKPSEDTSQEVSRVRKKGLKSGKIHPGKVSKGQANMVKRDATKRIFIARVPPVLTIHLKRFTQDARGRLTKLSGHVSFQETFDLRPYMDSRCTEDRCFYRLIGVVEHSGSMAGGHYVAYVRGDGSGSRSSRNSGSTGQAWFFASDAHVREVSLSEVLQSDAYILFYEKM